MKHVVFQFFLIMSDRSSFRVLFVLLGTMSWLSCFLISIWPISLQRSGCTSGTQTQGLSGPSNHRWFTPPERGSVTVFISLAVIICPDSCHLHCPYHVSMVMDPSAWASLVVKFLACNIAYSTWPVTGPPITTRPHTLYIADAPVKTSYNIFILLLVTFNGLLCDFWVRSQTGSRLSRLTGVPVKTTHWANSNERLRGQRKFTRKS